MRGKIVTWICTAGVVLALTGYTYAKSDESGEPVEGVLGRIEKEGGNTPIYQVSTDMYLEGIKYVPALLAGSDSATFFVLERASGITKFPCNQCHAKPLAALQADRADSLRKAHWDIELKHAAATVMNCQTCHQVNNFNTLRSLTGQEIDFNHSYQLCGQCHSKQLSDWVGGAHGKRVGGWAPPRVVKTCVNCHNQHQPAWEKRWPARASKPRE